MGSDYEENMSSKKQTTQHQHTPIKQKLIILFLIIATNLLTIYIFTSPHTTFQLPTPQQYSSDLVLLDLNATRDELVLSRTQITGLRNQLSSAHSLIEDLINKLTDLPNRNNNNNPTYDDLIRSTSLDEARLSIGPHKLPLGHNPKMGDEIYSSVGGGCLNHKSDLEKYMSYEIGEECPSDDVSAQDLMLKGCEPLPRRRCHPKSPSNYVDPTPLPGSLWATPPDTSIVWDSYTCKNYTCLKERQKGPGIYDCKDCFDLDGREKTRWLHDSNGLDYGIDSVLGFRPKGTIRIGLDIGGGAGSFAARMRERDVTIVTTSMNFDGPFNSFIASRGLVSMHVSVSQRLPFFENTLDIVHSMHVLSNWIPDAMLEFVLYDVYRVLRPGGIFWLDRFFCFGKQLNATYVPMFDRVGFGKLRWNTGMKVDRGVDKNEWYFSALLEKPLT